MKKRSSAFIALFLAFCMVIGYGFSFETAYAAGTKSKKTVKVQSVKLNHKVYTIKKGKTLKLKATVLPKNVSKKDKKVTWTSSNKKIATVKNGKVKGLKKGKTVITAKAKGKKAKCTVYVGTPVKKAVFKKKAITLVAGKSVTMKATLTPAKPTVKKIIYSSSNKKIAKVSSAGKITAVSAGKAVITAKPQDGAGKAAKLTVTVKPATVPVASVSIDPATMQIKKGETFTVKASVMPKNATNKNVSYKSSDEKVATVDANGKVTAVGRGDAVITATSADGAKTAECKLKVTPAGSETASTQADLDELLADENVNKITIKDSMTIGSEDNLVEREDLDLVIDAPNGHIENYGKFKSVQINSVGANSFIEHMIGNIISYAARSGKLVIEQDANAVVNLISGAENLNLVANGTINLNINVRVNVVIGGETRNTIPVNVVNGAQNSNITTSKELNVNTEVKIGLNIQAGGERTEVNLNGTGSEAEAEKILPDVSGLGFVCIRRTDEYYRNLVAVNNGDTNASTQTVNIEGSVEGTDGAALSGAKISVIPFEKEMSSSEVQAAAGKAAYSANTNANGAYSIANVKIGNYYLLAQKDGFAADCAKLILTSNDDEKHIAGIITLKANADAAKKGTLSGTITDALTGGSADKGLTLRLRKGGDNTSGAILETTNTVEGGKYAFTKQYEFGQYTVEVIDNRADSDKHYAATYFNAIINKEGANTVNSKASPTIESEQVRFVLTWGDEASGASADLDSHLVGPSADKKGVFHTWFSEREYADKDVLTDSDEQVIYADLDRDDVDWWGPETTTIYRPTEGVYSFYIHDYSNGGNNASNQMSKSKAQVEVYKGERKIAGPFNISSTTSGILWHVCDYNSATGKVKEVNKVLGDWAGEADEVGMSKEAILNAVKDRLRDTLEEAKETLTKLPAGEIKTEGQNAIAAAEAALNSEDAQAVRDTNNNLSDWIRSISNALYLDNVWTEILYPDAEYEDDYINLVYSYRTDDVYGEPKTEDDDEGDYLYSTLTISVGEENAPYDELKFRFGNDAVEWSLTNTASGDPVGYDRKLTATFAGQSRVWYVKQEVSEDYLLGVKNASHTRVTVDDEGEEYTDELIDNIDTFTEDDDESTTYIAEIRGSEDEFSFDTTFTLYNSKATWKLDPYNENGYVAKLTVSASGKTRVYLVRYEVSSYIKFGFDLLDEQGNIVSMDYLSDYYVEESDLYEVNGYTSAIPEYTVRPRYSKSTATIVDSGIDGSDKKVVVKCGDEERTTYLKYVKYEMDPNDLRVSEIYYGDSYFETWHDDYENDEIIIYVFEDRIPDYENFRFVPNWDNMTADFVEIDDPVYDGTVTLRLGDYSKVYNVRHAYTEEW